MPEYLVQTVQELGIFFGALGTFFVVLERAAKVIQIIVQRLRSRNLNARLKAILIVPTIEEVAKYSIKQPQKFELGEGLSRIDYRKEEEKKQYDILLERSQFRLLVLLVSFALAFGVMALRFLLTSIF